MAELLTIDEARNAFLRFRSPPSTLALGSL